MNSFSRWFVRHLSRKARPYLAGYGLLKTVKIKSALVWEPGDEKVLVLAPHMDDEVIGCGGALCKHVRRGAEVIVVYLTDGRFGSNALQDLSGEAMRSYQEELMKTRKLEARLAMDTLGIKEGIFFDETETMLASTPEVQEKLHQVLATFRPDIIYLPFFLEEHPDHWMTSQVLLDATRERNFRFNCLGYEVWTPLFPNCLVEIDDVAEVKKLAMQHYQSQLADTNYLHTSFGLNAYRSSALLGNRTKFVEAFFMASLDEYRELYQAYGKILRGPEGLRAVPESETAR